MTQTYSLSNVRTLLTQGFSDTELRQICHDTPIFKPVFDNLGYHSGKAEIVSELLQFADQKLLIEDLLALLEELNPQRYKEHQPYCIENTSPESGHLFIEATLLYLRDTEEYVTRFRSSVGTIQTPFSLPASANLMQELGDLRLGIERSINRQNFRSSTKGLDRAKVFGEKLFHSLFVNQALGLYHTCRQKLEESTVRDQRLIIKINPTTEELAALPWELLRDPQADYLAFDWSTPVIRFISDRPPRRFILDPEWRILLVASNPSDTDPLDLRDEIKRIETVLKEDVASHIKLKLETLNGPSPEDFRIKLRKFNPHIMHFMGHGGAGRLWLNQPGQGTIDIDEEELALILKNIPALRLVFLNACESAAAKSQENLGLAYTLSRAGMPAVVANQFPARDDAARTVSNEFYRWLAAGLPVDEALLWSRIALKNLRKGESATIEWTTPVLYLQATDGYLFNDFLLPSANVQEPVGSKTYEGTVPRTEFGEPEQRVQALQRQLKIRYGNLNHLEEQKAKFGLEVPLHIVNSIRDQQEAIEEIEAELAQLKDTAQSAASTEPTQDKADEKPQSSPEDVQDEVQKTLQAFMAALFKQGQLAYEAGNWGEAEDRFEKVQAQAPNYQDVTEKLVQVRQQLRWDGLYDEGLTYVEQKKWAQAEEVFRSIEPDSYHRRNLRRDLAFVRAMQVFDRVLKQAQMWADRPQDWNEVIYLLNPVVESSSKYRNATSKLEEARRYINWLENYETGKQYFQAEDWSTAIKIFETIPENYRDTVQQLNQARQQKELSEQYERGQKYFRWQSWREARDEFQAILKIDPNYKDVANLLREIDWIEQYNQAQKEHNENSLEVATATLAQILPGAPSHRRQEAQSLLETWRKEVKIRQAYDEGVSFFNAENWPAAVNALKRVVELEPNGYLDTAFKLEEANRKARLATLYAEALELIDRKHWIQGLAKLKEVQQLDEDYQDVAVHLSQVLQVLYHRIDETQAAEQWAEAIAILEHIRQLMPGDTNATTRLAELNQKRQLADWYSEARQAFEDQDWPRAVEFFQKLREQGTGNYKDTVMRYEEAKRQQWLAERYLQAIVALDNSDWDTAEEILKNIAASEVDYKDVQRKLAEVKRKKRLITLYGQAQTSAAAERWKEAITAYRLILDIDPTYGNTAEQLKLVEQARQLADLYVIAEQAVAAEEWSPAIEAYQTILAQVENYRDVKAKLERAKRSYQLHNLYQTARRSEQLGHLNNALEQYQTILEMEHGYKDAASKVQVLAQTLELADRYQQAVKLLQDNRFNEAIPLLQSILDTEPHFSDTAQLLNSAKNQQALATLYEKSDYAYRERNWHEAVDYLTQIQSQQSNYRDVTKKLIEVQQQLTWHQLYDQGLAYLNQKDWNQAINLLNQTQPDDGYRRNLPFDQAYSKAMLAYSQAKDQLEQGVDPLDSWQVVIALLTAVVNQDANYRDANLMLQAAQRYARWNNLYMQGCQAVENREWDTAIQAFDTIINENGNYRDTADQLVQARIQKQLVGHYRRATQYLQWQKWGEAQNELLAIQQLDPGYEDVSTLLQQITKEIKLAELYRQALQDYGENKRDSALVSLKKILEVMPDYRDGEVHTLFETWQKENEIRKAYYKGVELIEVKKWGEAIIILEHLFAIESKGFLDAAAYLELARQELQLQQKYTEANHFMQSQMWEQAIATFKAIQKLRTSYGDVTVLIGQAEEELWLKTQYEQTQQYQATEEWDKAITLFESIHRRRPDYHQVAQHLEYVKLQKQLAGWYAEARQAFEAADWGKVIYAFQKIKGLGGSEYKDIEVLYQQAEHNQHLADLYSQAKLAESSNFDTAEKLFTAAAELDPNYQDVQVRLATVRRQKRLMNLYDKAQAAFAAEDWTQAIENYRQVTDIDANYQEVAQKLRKAEQLKKVTGLYDAAEQAMSDKDWSQATKQYEAILMEVEDFHDVKIKLAQAGRLAQIIQLRQSAVQYEANGDWASALGRYKAILNLDPTLYDVVSKVKELEEALELARLYQSAIAALEVSRFTEGIPLLIQVVEKKQDYRDAKACLEKAIDDHFTVLLDKFHTAQNLEKQKRFKEARDQYKAYEQERKNSPWLITN